VVGVAALFTGLIEDVGALLACERDEQGARLRIESRCAAELAEGDSIAVAGVCLTAVGRAERQVLVEAMRETLERTTLAHLQPGDRVNIELPMRVGDRLGGHIVQGHVDGLGRVDGIAQSGFARELRISAPAQLARYIVHKGSIAVDGVSLTVSGLAGDRFSVSLIPETLERTTLGSLAVGDRVNLEVDVLAKHIERLLGERLQDDRPTPIDQP
jgi:riboflavin synthase